MDVVVCKLHWVFQYIYNFGALVDKYELIRFSVFNKKSRLWPNQIWSKSWRHTHRWIPIELYLVS